MSSEQRAIGGETRGHATSADRSCEAAACLRPPASSRRRSARRRWPGGRDVCAGRARAGAERGRRRTAASAFHAGSRPATDRRDERHDQRGQHDAPIERDPLEQRKLQPLRRLKDAQRPCREGEAGAATEHRDEQRFDDLLADEASGGRADRRADGEFAEPASRRARASGSSRSRTQSAGPRRPPRGGRAAASARRRRGPRGGTRP